MQIDDAPGHEEVTLTRKFGDEKCVTSQTHSIQLFTKMVSNQNRSIKAQIKTLDLKMYLFRHMCEVFNETKCPANDKYK